MLPVIISDDALEDMAGIRRYLLQFSNKAPDRIINALFDAYALLARYPHIGHTRPDLSDRPILFWSQEGRMIVYKASKERLDIIRVLDSHRDIKQIL